MDTVFMNFEDSKTSALDRLLLTLSDKMKLKRSDKYVALSNLRIYYTWKNIETLTTWNKKIELRDRSYYTSDIEKLKIIASISLKRQNSN